MRLAADRAHTGTTATVWNGKGFMKVEMANISAYQTRPSKPDLRIHVRPIHVTLPAILMNYICDLLYRFLIHTESAGISDHDPRKICGVLRCFCFQIGHIYI